MFPRSFSINIIYKCFFFLKSVFRLVSSARIAVAFGDRRVFDMLPHRPSSSSFVDLLVAGSVVSIAACLGTRVYRLAVGRPYIVYLRRALVSRSMFQLGGRLSTLACIMANSSAVQTIHLPGA